MTANDKSILFLGDANTLYYSAIDNNISAMRAYFLVPYIMQNAGVQARAFRLDFGDGEQTGIKDIYDLPIYDLRFDSGAWYMLDGQRLAQKPTKSGVYVNGGRKVVIK